MQCLRPETLVARLIHEPSCFLVKTGAVAVGCVRPADGASAPQVLPGWARALCWLAAHPA